MVNIENKYSERIKAFMLYCMYKCINTKIITLKIPHLNVQLPSYHIKSAAEFS